VIDVFPATDKEFRDQHANPKDYVRQRIENANEALRDEFKNEYPTPHLVITTDDQGDWGEWTNSGTDESTSEDRQEMKRKLDWPLLDTFGINEDNRREADVLSGFTGKNMDPTGISDPSNFADATAAPSEQPDSIYDLRGGVTLIGTSDTASLPITTTVNPPGVPPYTVTIPIRVRVLGDRFVDSYYLHELGHVIGAQHPGDYPGILSGTEGVMCKYSCFPTTDLKDTILKSKDFSDPNHNRILNNDEDWYDSWLDDDDYINRPPNVPRNLKTVSRAATIKYWKDGT